MTVNLAGLAEVLAFVAHEHRVEDPRVEFQLHPQSAQGQVDLKEICVSGVCDVQAPDPVEACVNKSVYLQLRFERSEQGQRTGKALLRTFINALMAPRVINLLQPSG